MWGKCLERRAQSASANGDNPTTLWPKPFWAGGLTKILRWYNDERNESVDFQATYVKPTASAYTSHGQGLPVVFYFAGLGSQGGFADMNLQLLANAAPVPFVIVAPFRQRGIWWVLSEDSSPWGFCDGEYLPSHVQRLTAWMCSVTNEPGINRACVSALGYSAGAYALTELLAHPSAPKLHGVILGGLHGHGQPDGNGIEGSKRMRRTPTIVAKWEAYLARLRKQERPPTELIGVHHTQDAVCPWAYTQRIYAEMDQCRSKLGLPKSHLKLLCGMKSRKNKVLHKYHDEALCCNEFLRHLLPDDSKSSTANPRLQAIVNSNSSTKLLASPRIMPQKRSSSRMLQKRSPSYECRNPLQCKTEPQTGRPLSSPSSESSTKRQKRCQVTLYEHKIQPQIRVLFPPPGEPIIAESHNAVASLSTYRQLRCARSSCWFLIHTDPSFGGFCCKKCHYRHVSGTKGKKKHGARCAQRVAPPETPRAEPAPPTNPLMP